MDAQENDGTEVNSDSLADGQRINSESSVCSVWPAEWETGFLEFYVMTYFVNPMDC